MKNLQKLFFLAILSISFLFVISCNKDNIDNTDPVVENITDFDFATIGDAQLNIDYKMAFNSPVLFKVFDRNPYKVNPNDPDLQVLDPEAKEIFKGITQDKGKFSGKISIKKSVTEIFLYTTTIGVPQLLKATISNNSFTIDATNEANFTEVASAGVKSTDVVAHNAILAGGFNTLGNWNSKGVPNYLLAQNDLISAELINDINASLPEDSKVQDVNPQFISQGVNSALHIIENAVVELVFVHEGAGYKNVLGYFHYPTNNPPASVNDINKIIAFPNASFNGSGGGLTSGNKVQLKYWDGSAFQNVFPAGTSIGWFIVANGYNNNGSINQYSSRYYSLSQFNPESTDQARQHNVLLYDQERALVLIGFEDLNRDGGSDDDFNDAVFYAAATPETAINYTNLPTIIKNNDTDNDGVPDDRDEAPNDGSYSYTTHYPAQNTFYTVAFEDLWPSRGDYDMNDVVVEYNSTHYLNAQNNVVKVTDRIRPVWAGGTLGSGFGYQLGVPSSSVASVTKTSTYNDPSFSYNISSNGTEAGQSKATIMVFDNINDLSLRASGEKPLFTMDINFNGAISPSTLTTPPYNPFIVINKMDNRSAEVHLPRKEPTSLANIALLGTYNDRSLPSTGRYYVSDDNMPFAILIPDTFEYPTESTNISVFYPKFSEWATSNGSLSPDWYLHKR